MVKYHKEDLFLLEKSDSYEALKYTLLKYTLLNGLSALTGERVLKILEEASNPEYMIKQFVTLMQSQPNYADGMVKELTRAHNEKKDTRGRPIKTNAIAYLISCWDEAKVDWQNLCFKANMTPEIVELRKELYEVIMDYPVENNIIALKKVNR